MGALSAEINSDSFVAKGTHFQCSYSLKLLDVVFGGFKSSSVQTHY